MKDLRSSAPEARNAKQPRLSSWGEAPFQEAFFFLLSGSGLIGFRGSGLIGLRGSGLRVSGVQGLGFRV